VIRRNGLVTICVLVCLTITLSIVLSLAKSTLRDRREVAVRLQLEQTQMLLDAGIRHAAVSLSESADYEGETWAIEDAIPGYFAAHVVIKRKADDIELIARLSNSSHDTIASLENREVGLVTQRSYRWER